MASNLGSSADQASHDVSLETPMELTPAKEFENKDEDQDIAVKKDKTLDTVSDRIRP